MKNGKAMLDMKVSRLTVDPFTDMPLVILKDEGGQEAVPIWIGLTEASAIAAELQDIVLDRPMTHDLMTRMLIECGLQVDRVEVNDLRDKTFFATIHLIGPEGRAIALDSRPSDAIALALRTGARICVARKVIARARRMDLAAPTDGEPDPGGEAESAAFLDLLEGLSDDEFGKWKM